MDPTDCLVEWSPCDLPSEPCQCVWDSASIRDARACGFPTNPCELTAGAGNPCGCVSLTSTVVILGNGPSRASGSCGIPRPGGGGEGPNPCEGLAEETCGCVSLGDSFSNIHIGALSRAGEVCGVPTNPCGLVGDGALDDGCGCVEMGGPQRVSLLNTFAATSVATGAVVIPTSICGIPVPSDPCASGFGAFVCDCVAQLQQEVVQGEPLPQRLVTPPVLCVEVEGVPDADDLQCVLDDAMAGVNLGSLGSPDFYPGWQNGESNWAVFLDGYLPCDLKVPVTIPLMADLGSLRKDVYNKTWTQDEYCTHVWDPIGYDYHYYNMTLVVTIQDTDWRGQLPFGLEKSTVAFDLPNISKEFHAYEEFGGSHTDLGDEVNCAAAYWGKKATLEAEAIKWVNTSLQDLLVPCKGSLVLLNGFIGTGELAGECFIKINILTRAYEWEGNFPLQRVGGSTVMLVGRGSSLFSSP